ncbi:hypothetical protein EBB07_13350 [Paenibacillaceae bacterium]|nr:hypothetical protein EBB07_13350 [Paenibacillaceae bacterium]
MCMRKLGKWLKIALFTGVGIIMLSVIVVYAFVIKRPTAIPVADDTKPYKWNKVELGEQTFSSDGSEYYLLTKKGESSNWIIFFSGGGVSWDEKSAAEPITILKTLKTGELGNYFANIPFYKVTLLKGMLETENADNPFQGWNVAYIPYTTGDFHIGNRTAEYNKEDGSSFTMRYNGTTNVRHSLEWIYENAGEPEKLLIAGESAGGFGSAFWASEIASHYNESDIYHYSDSSFLKSDKWPNIVDNEWNADFEAAFGFVPEADIIGSVFKANRQQLPENAILLQSYSLYDDTLIHFQYKINDDVTTPIEQKIANWSRELRTSVRSLSNLPNYYYYLTDYGLNPDKGTTPHTFTADDNFYQTEQDGVKLLRWLDDIVNKQQHYSVGGKFIE